MMSIRKSIWKSIQKQLVLLVLIISIGCIVIYNYDTTSKPSAHMFRLMNELKLNNRSSFQQYIKSISDSDLNELVQNYGVSGLTSPSLQRLFMACPGFCLLKRFTNAEGVIQIPKNQNCKKMSFRDSGTPVALVSWPGSGNSWVRLLLESTTGIYTGGVDCDFSYYAAGMIGEGIVSNNVIVVKSHWEPPTWNFTNKILYIVRNPFDVFVADWNREQGHSHVAVANDSYFGKYMHVIMSSCLLFVIFCDTAVPLWNYCHV